MSLGPNLAPFLSSQLPIEPTKPMGKHEGHSQQASAEDGRNWSIS